MTQPRGRAAVQGAQIVVWPETALPGLIELDAPRMDALGALARETGSALVVGAVGSALSEDGGQIAHFYDSEEHRTCEACGAVMEKPA